MYYIGSQIRAARRRAELTQEQLSESIGVTPQYLSDLERGLVGTSIPTLMKICRRLNVSSDFILFGMDNQSAPGSGTLIEKIQSLPEARTKLVEVSVDLMLEAMEMDPSQLR